MTIHAMIGSKSPCDKHVAVTTPVSFATGYVLVCNPRCHMKKRRNEWLRLRWNLCSEYPFFVDDALSLFSLSPNSNVVDVLYIYISFISHWSPLPQDMHSLFGYQSRNDVLKKKMYLCVLKLFLVLRSC
jgi:hypothetical protein